MDMSKQLKGPSSSQDLTLPPVLLSHSTALGKFYCFSLPDTYTWTVNVCDNGYFCGYDPESFESARLIFHQSTQLQGETPKDL